MFVRYELRQPDPDLLRLRVVDDNAMKGVDASSSGIRRAIATQMRGRTLLADACTCVRIRAR